jgi:NAD(P)-dependent dehydrogenase (short-subunit alcohol dehydrogenase family)
MNGYYSSGAKQTVVVTGGHQGLGLACAETLACSDQNWCVIIAGHERDRIAAAADALLAKCKAHVEPMLLNLASLRSIRFFSENLSEKLRDGHIPPLRALICNEGVAPASGIAYTTDGFEQNFGVNHLGHFLLVNLLLGQMTPPARIVIASSGTRNPFNSAAGVKRWDRLEARRLAWPESPEGFRLSGWRRYRASKLCNLLFASELNRRLAEMSPPASPLLVNVNVFDPLLTPGTLLTRSWPGLLQYLWQSKTLHSVARCFGAKISTVEKSGRSMAGIIMNPFLQRITGKYIQELTEREPGDIPCDPALAVKLWEDSAELVNWNRPPEVQAEVPALLYPEPVHQS